LLKSWESLTNAVEVGYLPIHKKSSKIMLSLHVYSKKMVLKTVFTLRILLAEAFWLGCIDQVME